jgi:hypothetical protein
MMSGPPLKFTTIIEYFGSFSRIMDAPRGSIFLELGMVRLHPDEEETD